MQIVHGIVRRFVRRIGHSYTAPNCANVSFEPGGQIGRKILVYSCCAFP
jgi:hypothetical protein